MATQPLTVVVPRGTKVDIKEVDALSSEDPRATDDRDALIIGGENLKIAVRKAAAPAAGAAAAFITMCG
ncbi:hypothetical protein QFZ94_008419 [Paraburkholderia sp. JPY465]